MVDHEHQGQIPATVIDVNHEEVNFGKTVFRLNYQKMKLLPIHITSGTMELIVGY